MNPQFRTLLPRIPAELNARVVNGSSTPLWPRNNKVNTPGNPASSRKAQVDAVLLKLAGVSTKKIGGVDAYLVNDRMFACISGDCVGLRLPVATARELQFSRENVSAMQLPGMPASKEWIQIERADASEYEKDLELFQASLDFVKGGGR